MTDKIGKPVYAFNTGQSCVEKKVRNGSKK